MLPTVIQFALGLAYVAVALWSAINSVLEHPDGRISLRELLIILVVSLFWILFYPAALLAACRLPAPAKKASARRRRVL